MNVLVTGGAGYIGSHACKILAAKGLEPIVYDDLSRGYRWAARYGPLEVGAIGDTGRIRSVLERYRPSAVMHFAAYINVGESVSNPLLYYRNNIAETLSLMEAIVASGPIPVVFSSSCATYGVPEKIPMSEDHPQHPVNPYGVSKLVIERLLQDLDTAHGLRSVSLRYFNAAGADPDGEIGEAHDPETHLIPLVLAAARDGTAIRVFGNDYDTPDGTCVRDYIHVNDIADAHVRALKYLVDGGTTCAFNLANERGYSVLEVIAVAERVTGMPIRIEMVDRRPGDAPILIGSSGRAKSQLGWKPARSELALQILDAWNWMTKKMTALSGT
jgi:UDP-glucose-4-epimerase GalE